MSLLNLPSDGNRGVLVAIYRLLLAEGSTEYDRVVSLCAAGDPTDSGHIRRTLNTWIELGLFERSASEKVSIHSQIPGREREEKWLPVWASRRALAPENNLLFWEAEKSHSADFTRATAWLLSQNVYETELDSWKKLQPQIDSQIPEDEHIFGRNDTRWNGLRSWVPYLGFGSVGNTRGSPLMIDPTEALRHALPQIFGKRVVLAADEFLLGIAAAVPILDGGEYRLKVEEKLRDQDGPKAWRPPPEGQVSTSLSRALLRLVMDGTLLAEARADSPTRARLTGREQTVLHNYSHFSFRPSA